MFELRCDKSSSHLILTAVNHSLGIFALLVTVVLLTICSGDTADISASDKFQAGIQIGLGSDIVLIDTSVYRYQNIRQAVCSGIQVLLFDGRRESPDEILLRIVAQASTQQRHIRSISIISHGTNGAFKFGNRWIDADTLVHNAGAWRMLGRVMKRSGHIYLYGCNVAGGKQTGLELINTLAAITGSIVFASDDITGRGGDWYLEAASTNNASGPFLKRIDILDVFALADLPFALANYNETGWSGSGTFTDGTISFSLSLDGGTIDWSYTGSTNTLTISDNDLTSWADSLTITDNNGGLIIDNIIIDTDLGTINSTTDIGGSLQISAGTHVDHILVGGGYGAIAQLQFLGSGSQNLGTVQIDADIATLTVQPGMDIAAGTDLTVAGNVGTITGINTFNDGGYITTNGNLGAMSIGGNWGGSLTVRGLADTITVTGNLSSSGAIDISGSVTTQLNFMSDMNGTVAVTGSLADLQVGNNLGGTLTVGGDAGSIFVGNDFPAGGRIDIGGNVTDLTVGTRLSGPVIIGGDAGIIHCGYGSSGDITVEGDLSGFYSGHHDYTGVITVKHAAGQLIIEDETFYDDTTYPPTSLVVYNGATNSFSDYLTLDLDADDSSGESPVGFANTFAVGGGPVPAVDIDDAYIDTSDYDLTIMTVTILNLQDGAAEVLACDVTGTNITGAYNSDTGVLTLSGADKVGHYEQVLLSITYDNTAGTPTGGDRRLLFSASNAVGSLITNSATAIISVPASGGNNPPTAADGGLSVAEDTTYTVQNTDFGYSDIDGDLMTQVQITALPLLGTLELGGNSVALHQMIEKTDIDLGLLTYTPALNGNGASYTDFSFRVHDGTDLSTASYTLTVDVSAENDAPSGADATLTMDENTTCTLMATDFGYTDPDGDPLLQVQITTLPASGNLEYNAGAVALDQIITAADIDLGRLTFTPAPNASGSGYAAFDFRVHDGTVFSAAPNTLTVNVTSTNTLPTGSDNTLTVDEDTDYSLTAADFGYADSDGDPMAQVQITTLPAAGYLEYSTGAVRLNQVISAADIGLGLLTFTPAPNASGSGYASFGFAVHDGTDYSAASNTLTMNVTAVNDAPSGNNGTVTTAENTAYVVQSIDFGYIDPDGDPMAQVQITAVPTAGALEYNSSVVTINQVITTADIGLGLLTFTPAPNASGYGYASFGFAVHDGSDYSAASFTMTVDVIAANNTPTGAGSTVTLAEDTVHTLNTGDFGYTDPDGDALSQVQITVLPAHGALQYDGTAVAEYQVITEGDIASGRLTFTPAADAFGTGYSYFRFRVHDGTQYAASSGTLLFDVTAVNDPPSVSDHRFTIYRDIAGGSFVGNVSAADADPGDTLIYTISTQSVKSLFAIDSASGTISLEKNAELSDSGLNFYTFSVQVSDGLESRDADITVEILEKNDTPGGGDTVSPVIVGTGPPTKTPVKITDDAQPLEEPVYENDEVSDAEDAPPHTSADPISSPPSSRRRATTPGAGTTRITAGAGNDRRPRLERPAEINRPVIFAGQKPPVTKIIPTEPHQWRLDTLPDKIEMKNPGTVSTWYGKLLVGTVTIFIPFLSLLLVWGFQGTSFLASSLFAIPLWRTFDPLPILDTQSEDDRARSQTQGSRNRVDSQWDRAEVMFDTALSGDSQPKNRKSG